MSKEQLRQRIIQRLNRIKSELEQLIRDKQSWNANRTDAIPFDLGWELSLLDVTKKEITAWETGNIDEANRLAKCAQDLCAKGDE